MLQYIKWLWVNEDKKNMDKLISIIAVSKIENTYLKYKSHKRKQIKEKDKIKQSITEIISKSSKNKKRIQNKPHKLPYLY